jgi:hypothetical protein
MIGSNMCMYSQDRVHIEQFRLARQGAVILFIYRETASMQKPCQIGPHNFLNPDTYATVTGIEKPAYKDHLD